MTLTGRAAQRHPEVDGLTRFVVEIATHTVVTDRHGDTRRETTGAARADVLGQIDPDTGAYHNAANTISEADRRTLRLRRNGRPRRRPAAGTAKAP